MNADRESSTAGPRRSEEGLRIKALKGGGYLAGRELAGIAIRLAGMLLLTRMLGPVQYGLYAAGVALVTPVAMAAQMGTEVYLIRKPEEPLDSEYHEVFTFLVVTAAALSVLGFGVSFLVDDWLDSRYVGPFQVLLLSVPINVLWAPAQAKLERNFRYRRLAWMELGGDFVLYGVALTLAWGGLGVWAAVGGYLAWQTWLLLASYAFAGYRPRLRWSVAAFGSLFRHGRSYVPGSVLSRSAEYVVNPLVVGRFLGPASVGYVALAMRIADTLSFVTRATWRLSIVALAKVQRDYPRLRRGLEESIALQLLALGPVLAAFAVASPLVVPTLFGERWDATIDFFPYAGLTFLAGSIFTVHASVLYVFERNSDVLLVNLIKLGVLIAVALLLVPELGLVGYGLATAAPLAVLLLSDARVRRLVEFRYTSALPWIVGFGPALFVPLLGWPWAAAFIAPVFVVPMLPRARRQLAGYGTLLKGGVMRARPS